MSIMIGPPKTHVSAAAGGSAATEEKLHKSAHDFEAMVVDQMIQPMFATLGQEQGMFDGGAAEQTIRPLLLTEFAKMMESRGGLGLEGAIMKSLAHEDGSHR